MANLTRREFTHKALQSLTVAALLDGLLAHRLFGADVKPLVDEWLKELTAISKECRDHTIKDVEFQASLERLFGKVDLPSLLRTLDFERIARGLKVPDRGAKSLPVEFKQVAGLPTDLVYGRQIFAMGKGRSVVPHGHDNMATGFLVLSGNFHGRNYDRVEDLDDHYIIKSTIDRTFKPGEYSTVSDHRDNVHWFTSLDEPGFIFNIHVNGSDPDSVSPPGRVYVDPLGEKLSGGLVKAPKITHAIAEKKYG